MQNNFRWPNSIWLAVQRRPCDVPYCWCVCHFYWFLSFNVWRHCDLETADTVLNNIIRNKKKKKITTNDVDIASTSPLFSFCILFHTHFVTVLIEWVANDQVCVCCCLCVCHTVSWAQSLYWLRQLKRTHISNLAMFLERPKCSPF